MTKPRIIILEGPDGAGKTSVVKRLSSSNLYKKYFSEVTFIEDRGTIEITSPNQFESLIRMMEYFDPRKVFVIDRFILTDLLYGKVLRSSEDPRLKKVFKDFQDLMSPHYVILTRDPGRDDYRDEKIVIRNKDFVPLCDEYKTFEGFEPKTEVWKRTIFEEGVFQEKLLSKLITELAFVYAKPQENL